MQIYNIWAVILRLVVWSPSYFTNRNINHKAANLEASLNPAYSPAPPSVFSSLRKGQKSWVCVYFWPVIEIYDFLKNSLSFFKCVPSMRTTTGQSIKFSTINQRLFWYFKISVSQSFTQMLTECLTRSLWVSESFTNVTPQIITSSGSYSGIVLLPFVKKLTTKQIFLYFSACPNALRPFKQLAHWAKISLPPKIYQVWMFKYYL